MEPNHGEERHDGLGRQVLGDSWVTAGPLKVPCFLRLVPPIVVPAIRIFDGRSQQLRRADIIQCGQEYRNVIPSDLLDKAPPERAHATVFAEQMVCAQCAELIVAEIPVSGQQAEIGRLDDDAPIAGLRANGAIALARARAQIDIRFITDRSTMTTSRIRFFHRVLPGLPPPDLL